MGDINIEIYEPAKDNLPYKVFEVIDSCNSGKASSTNYVQIGLYYVHVNNEQNYIFRIHTHIIAEIKRVKKEYTPKQILSHVFYNHELQIEQELSDEIVLALKGFGFSQKLIVATFNEWLPKTIANKSIRY